MKFLKLFFSIYLFVGFIFFIKFNYECLKNDGFAEWWAFGEVKASAKAVVWPYFLLKKDKPVKETKSLEHFKSAILYIQYAFDLQKEFIGGESPFTISKSDPRFQQVVEYLEKSLYEAKLVDKEELRLIDQELPNHFSMEFILGLEYYLLGLKNDDHNLANQGLANIYLFREYYQSLTLE